jgi:hypothetical protein
MGLILCIVVTAASVQDRDGARPLLWQLAAGFRAITLVWADGGYAGKLVTWVASTLHRTLQIVKRPDNLHTFKIMPRRWVVSAGLTVTPGLVGQVGQLIGGLELALVDRQRPLAVRRQADSSRERRTAHRSPGAAGAGGGPGDAATARGPIRSAIRGASCVRVRAASADPTRSSSSVMVRRPSAAAAHRMSTAVSRSASEARCSGGRNNGSG